MLVRKFERHLKNILSFFALLSVGLLSACEVIDNQDIANENDKQAINVEPTDRPFAKQNARHKILVAALDSGVDYNHPALLENMHFELDRSGRPVGIGYDFLANDVWPTPYVARTSVYDTSMSSNDRSLARDRVDLVKKILEKNPGFKRFLSPQRNIEQELEAAVYHGTHVAGLMVYDDPRIGFLPFRILPANLRDSGLGDSASRVLNAITLALQSGARVINMSLGVNGRAPFDETFIEFRDKMAELARSHPNVVFVVAAGNDGAWLDGKNKATLPCDVDVDNILCVSALNLKDQPASFTNISLSRNEVVFALGESVISTMPTLLCSSEQLVNLLDSGSNDFAFDQALAGTAEDCVETDYGRLTGTSMASPLVAHLVAKVFLEEPTLTGAQAVRKILDRASNDRVGDFRMRKLNLEKPSWYAKWDALLPIKSPDSGMGISAEKIRSLKAREERESGWTAFEPRPNTFGEPPTEPLSVEYLSRRSRVSGGMKGGMKNSESTETKKESSWELSLIYR